MGAFGDVMGAVGSMQGWDQTQRDREDQENMWKLYGAPNHLLQSTSDLAGYKSNLNSGFAGMSTDPRLRQAQMDALNQMSGIASSNGMDPQSMAMQHQAEQRSLGTQKAQRDAAMQSAQARGVAGSGAEEAALLSGQQAGANAGAMGAEQAAADARQRSMAALGQMSGMANGIRGQDWSEQAQRAEAMDNMAKYNQGRVLAVQGLQNQLTGLDNDYASKYSGFYDKDINRKYANTLGMWQQFGNMGDDALGNLGGMGGGGGGGFGGMGGGGGGEYI